MRSERIVVVGSSCAGKTTFAERYSKARGIPHTQLDALHWLPNWVARDAEDFKQRVIDAAAEDCWIMDGNYQVVRAQLWSRATTIIWLNYSFSRVIWQCLKRSVRRSVTREQLFGGNVESFRRTFLSRDSIILWVLTTYHEKQKRYQRLLDSDMARQCTVIEFKRPAEAQAWLQKHRPKAS